MLLLLSLYRVDILSIWLIITNWRENISHLICYYYYTASIHFQSIVLAYCGLDFLCFYFVVVFAQKFHWKLLGESISLDVFFLSSIAYHVHFCRLLYRMLCVVVLHRSIFRLLVINSMIGFSTTTTKIE